MKTVAIIQSNYIPWKGYFDVIQQVDEFIIYDDMQYTRRDWRNRNLIKTPNGVRWLTIPVNVKGNYFRKIKDIYISESNWVSSHWGSLKANYSKAPYFETYSPFIQSLYNRSANEKYLSRVNYLFLRHLCDLLGISTPITWSMDYELVEGKTERLIGLCRSAGATRYLSGPAAKDYIEPQLFRAAGIDLVWVDYSGYPEYKQDYPPFTHGVTILDLLFHTGPDAPWYIWGWRQSSAHLL